MEDREIFRQITKKHPDGIKAFQDLTTWYNKEYKEKKESFGVPIAAYYQTLMGLIENCNREKTIYVLDVACGQGYALSAIDDFLWQQCATSWKLYGTDLSDEAIKLSEKNCHKAKFKQGAAEDLPYKTNIFDYVICIGSLEHFVSQYLAMKEMMRVGNEVCRYLILVPNKCSLFHNKTQQQEINERMRSLYGWKALFERTGFQTKSIRKDTWHITNEKNWFKKLLKKLTPKMFFHSLIFILEKAK